VQFLLNDLAKPEAQAPAKKLRLGQRPAFKIKEQRRMGLRLRIIQGHDAGKILPVSESSILLGRATTHGEHGKGFLFFYEATVSRQHAELAWDAKKKAYWLYQRSQTNKTLVDNQPVDAKNPTLLKVGSKIQMGLLILTLEDG